MNAVNRKEIHAQDVNGVRAPVGTHLHEVADVDEVGTSLQLGSFRDG